MNGAAGSLSQRVAAGAAFMVMGKLAIRLISIVSTLVLVRLLVPEDFGVVALAAAGLAIADTLTATGYAALLVRRPSVDRDAYDTAWTLNLIRCVLLAGLVAVTAPWQAQAFGEPRIEAVLIVVALSMVLDGFVSIGLARLQRELRFDLLFRHQVAVRFLAFAFTILLAIILGNYWCLVLGNILAKVFTIPYSYYLAPHRPRLRLTHWREFFHFSKWMFGFNLCAAVDGQVGNISLGSIAGAAALGKYNVAYQISATPVTDFAAPLRQPLYAGYALVQDDAAKLRAHYLESCALMATATIPLSVGIALVAPELERVALGPNWVGTAPLIALCALYALADNFAHFTFNIFGLKDRLRLMVVTYACLALLRLPMVVLGAWLGGAFGMVLGLLTSSVINMLVWNLQTGLILGHRLRQFGDTLMRPLLAASAMAAAVLALRTSLGPDVPGVLDDIVRLAIISMLGASVHIVTQYALWWAAGRPATAERRLLAMATGGWRKFRTPSPKPAG